MGVQILCTPTPPLKYPPKGGGCIHEGGVLKLLPLAGGGGKNIHTPSPLKLPHMGGTTATRQNLIPLRRRLPKVAELQHWRVVRPLAREAVTYKALFAKLPTTSLLRSCPLPEMSLLPDRDSSSKCERSFGACHSPCTCPLLRNCEGCHRFFLSSALNLLCPLCKATKEHY